MLIQSHTPQGAPHDAPVAMFSYESKHKLLAIAKTYEDMIQAVKHKFELQNSGIALYTSNLNVCNNNNAEIDETAYPFLVDVLEHVSIVLQETQGKQSENAKSGPSIPPVSSDTEEFEEVEVATPEPQVLLPKPSGTILSTQSTSSHPISRTQSKSSDNQSKSAKPPAPSVQSGTRAQSSTASSVVKKDNPPKFRAAMRPKAGNARPTAPPKATTQERRVTPPSASQESAKNVAASADERFKIHITSPDDQYSEFKTRGGHLIKKVLVGACKTFGLHPDGYLLYKTEHIVDEKGREIEEMTWCNPELTVAQQGLLDGDQLLIEPEGTPSDDLSEISQ